MGGEKDLSMRLEIDRWEVLTADCQGGEASALT